LINDSLYSSPRKDFSNINFASKTKKPCIIWAVTAMNEDEIDFMVDNGILDGISCKPITIDKLKEILN
jgi:hypothetical protein